MIQTSMYSTVFRGAHLFPFRNNIQSDNEKANIETKTYRVLTVPLSLWEPSDEVAQLAGNEEMLRW